MNPECRSIRRNNLSLLNVQTLRSTDIRGFHGQKPCMRRKTPKHTNNFKGLIKRINVSKMRKSDWYKK
jgi:hypothetical protein